MLYAMFDNIHALVNPIRQDILRGGPTIDVFVFFFNLEFEFLTTNEVSRNSLSHQGKSIPPCLIKF